MPNGYYGKVLRVNLSTGVTSVDEHEATFYRRYLGGAAMAAYYLLKELAPRIDPLGPDNKLVIAPGVLTGVPVSGNAMFGVGAKSPMSEGIGKSESGGYFGAELKHAGYDGIVIEGTAERPTYLWIKDGVAELRDASPFWGMGTLETEEAVKAEVGEKLARIASIGPAGERMVRFACIVNDLRHAAGRGGMGAVMGSKKLKAIAVRGKIPPAYGDPDTIRAMGKRMAAAGPTIRAGMHEYGTGSVMVGANLAGNTPTRNWQDGYFENIGLIDAVTLKKTIGAGMDGCYACSIRCKKVVRVDEPWVADARYGGPEYETLAAFGSDCGIDNLKAIARAHHLCNHYGIDTITAGTTIAFAMECFEKGYLTKADFDGVEPTWGNAEAMLKLLEMMGERNGIGDLLAEGSRAAAARIGGGAGDLSIHVKGIEVGMHEPRLKGGLAIGYCVANQGGDHGICTHDTSFENAGPSLDSEAKPLGILDPIPAKEISGRKANLFAQLHRWKTFLDTVCCCHFVPWGYDEVAQLVNGVTGWNTTAEELMLAGERAITLGRAFNVREGFTPSDDQLPKRFFSPPERGPLAENRQAIDPQQIQEAVRDYYYLMGWDRETGVPSRVTLERLGIGWVGDELEKQGRKV